MPSEASFQATLDESLPTMLEVGRGLSVLMAGAWSSVGKPVHAIRLLVNGEQQELAGLSDRSATGGRWWGVVDLAATQDTRPISIVLESRRGRGEWMSAALGTVELTADWAPSRFDYRAAAERRDGSITGALELKPLVAICLATDSPDPELFRRWIEAISAQTYENWQLLVCDAGHSVERLMQMRAAVDGSQGIEVRSPTLGDGDLLGAFEQAVERALPEAPFIVAADLGQPWGPQMVEQTLNQLKPGSNAVLRRSRGYALFRRELLPYVLPLPQRVSGEYTPDVWVADVAAAVGGVDRLDSDGALDAGPNEVLQSTIAARTLLTRCDGFLGRDERRRLTKRSAQTAPLQGPVPMRIPQTAVSPSPRAAELARAWIARATAIAPLLNYQGGPSGGERGVLEKILSILPERGGHAVQLDRGIGLGPARYLSDQRGWSALHLAADGPDHPIVDEPEPGRVLTSAREALTPDEVCESLRRYDVPEDLDFLLIATYGADLDLWAGLIDTYAASLVAVTYNPYVPHGVRATVRPDANWRWDLSKNYGASFSALVDVAERSGYRLLHVHGPLKLYFLRADMGFPSDLSIASPLSEEELSVVSDADGFYRYFVGERSPWPAWKDVEQPALHSPPWELV